MNANEQNPNEIPEDLLKLYKDWVKYYSNRTGLYSDRLDVAWASLFDDINRWKAKLALQPKNHLVHHHVCQFEEYIDRAYKALITDSSQVQQADSMEVLDFRALVIGVFTAQWLLLQNVAAQRIDGSPYQKGVDELDNLVIVYYARLYHVFTEKIAADKLDNKYRQKPFATFAPLVYLGSVAQLAVFNQRIPLMLSIPLGALELPQNPEQIKNSEEEVAQIRMAIPHEVAHAIFAQVPELINEIKEKLKTELNEGRFDAKSDAEEMSRRDHVLYEMAIEWTDEICADLIGTALAGELYAQSACWTMSGTTLTAGITDVTHPPAVLRPIIHLLALSTLMNKKVRFEKTLYYFKREITESGNQVSVDFSLDRRFRSVPALMFVRLETVSDILCHLVQRILTLPLETLFNESLGALLPAIYQLQKAELPSEALPKWGEDPAIKDNEFVLDFPADLIPSYTTPGISMFPDIPIISYLLDLVRPKSG